jgi:hypothetical protein
LDPDSASSHFVSESHNDGASNDQIAWGIAAADDQLAPFFPTPFANFATSLNADDILMQPSLLFDVHTQSDSGYYSITGNSIGDCGEPLDLSKRKEHRTTVDNDDYQDVMKDFCGLESIDGT